ncbi:MAG: hypothetical protein GTO18_11055 [Anaerolineales bacterium]|nr:hypothetical protein [Anaerolineales bacterium]
MEGVFPFLDNYLIRVVILGAIGLVLKALLTPVLSSLTRMDDYLLKAAWKLKDILERPTSSGETAEVPYLVFGHTHDPNMVRLGKDGPWYVNTGNWLNTIDEVESWSRLERDFTFLQIAKPDKNKLPGLFRWNPNTYNPEQIRIRTGESKEKKEPNGEQFDRGNAMNWKEVHKEAFLFDLHVHPSLKVSLINRLLTIDNRAAS